MKHPKVMDTNAVLFESSRPDAEVLEDIKSNVYSSYLLYFDIFCFLPGQLLYNYLDNFASHIW